MILEVVNSFVGKRGNIGLRTGHVLDELDRREVAVQVLARGAVGKYRKCATMGLSGHLPRLLNAVRIYVLRPYNHRRHDLFLFNRAFFRYMKTLERDVSLVHLWEQSPEIIRHFRRKSIPVVLDVPIAPTAYVLRLNADATMSVAMQAFAENDAREKEAFALADLLIAPSRFVRDELMSAGVPADKICTIPFGADLTVKSVPREGAKQGLDFCFAGSVCRRKGVEVLLEAWDHPAFSEDRLHLCGRVYPEIKSMLKQNGPANVHVPGFVDTAEYFSQCHAYVFPSYLEGSSKSVYEAMAAGLPCVVTESSGSVIRDGVDGYVVSAGDVQGLREKMLRLKRFPEERLAMGESARAAVQRYSWKAYGAAVADVYKSMLDGMNGNRGKHGVRLLGSDSSSQGMWRPRCA